MSKKKQAKARLPKAIAGVKLGKDLRKSIAPVLRFAHHPMVNELLTAALLAGADSLIGKKGRSVTGAVADAALSGVKKRGSKGLVLAVAAGEIAAQIVGAYGARAKQVDSPRKATKVRRKAASKAKLIRS
jgi:hypothetical protein